MAIVIGDIHGDLVKAKAFLSYKPKQEHVALGDLTDNRKNRANFEEEAACLDLLLDSDAVIIWGNHDLAYLPERPWECFGNFGIEAFSDRFQSNRNRFKAAYAVDEWLCTHAGISPKLGRLMPSGVIAAGASGIAKWLNEKFLRELQDVPVVRNPSKLGIGLFNRAYCRGGLAEFGGIFWYDAGGEQSMPSPLVGRQIFGHSPVPYPERGTNWINLNHVEGGIWVYDTGKDEMVEL